MICPKCKEYACRRSRRRGLADYAIGLTGMRPWRCRKCDLRFFAWSVPLSYSFNAHCRLCGNLSLQRVSNEYVKDGFHWFWRKLHAPAYRCAPCRYRFFSILPQRRNVPPEPETVAE